MTGYQFTRLRGDVAMNIARMATVGVICRRGSMLQRYESAQHIWLRWVVICSNDKNLEHERLDWKRMYCCFPAGVYTDRLGDLYCHQRRLCPWCYMRSVQAFVLPFWRFWTRRRKQFQVFVCRRSLSGGVSPADVIRLAKIAGEAAGSRLDRRAISLSSIRYLVDPFGGWSAEVTKVLLLPVGLEISRRDGWRLRELYPVDSARMRGVLIRALQYPLWVLKSPRRYAIMMLRATRGQRVLRRSSLPAAR